MNEAAPQGVTVVTATAGRPDLMLQKLEALTRQTLSRDQFEWRITMDGADPGLEKRLRAACPDDFSMFLTTTPGVGPGPARDAAARDARFSVLVFSDDDCLPPPDLLERHLAAQAEPAVYVGAITFDDGVQPWDWRVRRPNWGNVNGANTSCPTSTFHAVGGFGDALVGYGGEDVWLGWRLTQESLAVKALPGAPVRHVGPAPQRRINAGRMREAGANAARIAAMDPRTAWRLGVHPVQHVVKDVFLSIVRPFGGATVQRECAYLEGVKSARQTGRGPA